MKRLPIDLYRYPTIHAKSDVSTGMSEGVEQLQQELSKKNMIFSKDSIEISKVIGQGTCIHNIECCSNRYMYISYILTGESGVVHRGYFKTRGGKQLVAIKTCKGILLL